MKERNHNRARAQYADFTFNVKETCEDVVFDTSSKTVQTLIPRRYWFDQQKTITWGTEWQFAHFRTPEEYNELKNQYYRFRVDSWYMKIWDMQITKIEGGNATIAEGDLTNFMLQTTEFPIMFYKDDGCFLGQAPDVAKIPPDMLMDMHKGFKKRLPINGPIHFGWKISKADKTDKWWETSLLKADWVTGPSDINHVPTNHWGYKAQPRQRWYTRPILHVLFGLDTRYVEDHYKVHITFRYQCGIKIAASGQKKTFYKDTYKGIYCVCSLLFKMGQG